MFYYKTDKGGNITAEHEGEEIKGWIPSETKIDATKFKYYNNKFTEKEIKPVDIKKDTQRENLILENLRNKKFQEFESLKNKLLLYKCDRDNPDLIFALCGVFGDEKQAESKKWVQVIIELTKNFRPEIKKAKTADDLNLIKLPVFEDLRNQSEEIFYK